MPLPVRPFEVPFDEWRDRQPMNNLRAQDGQEIPMSGLIQAYDHHANTHVD
jgi:hypothetical protein